jgi:hypothetical protein|tara:strand:- start:960 stop:1208 length:249 start_codon:yes stop_codon:yes gene_type:complete
MSKSTITKKDAKSSEKTRASLGETLTTVKTIYARAVLLLITLNFAFTGYAVYSLTQMQSEVMSSPEAVTETKAFAQPASTEQ